MKLTGKQKHFALFYAACLNATEAAKLAGYKAKNEATFRAIGAENLTKPSIKAEIDRLLTEKTMQSHEVLSRLSEQATADPSDFFDINAMTGQPRLDLAKAAERGKIHLIKKITFGELGFVKSIELHSSQAALVHLGKAYGLFTDKLQIDDWRSRAIEDIREGRIAYQALADGFDESLAADLFRAAGIPIPTKQDTPIE